MERVERVWHRRLRWRLRGAWQWPLFLVLTLVNAIVLVLLPAYRGGPEALFPAVLLAGSANLLALILLAPPLGRLLRRRRPDLPRIVASDYAGATLLVAITGLAVGAGLLHRSSVQAEEAREQAVAAAMHDYVVTQAPQYQGALGSIDAIRIEQDHYRACVPAGERRWLCLFVSTDQQPPGVTRDTEEVSNRSYRPYGGFD